MEVLTVVSLIGSEAAISRLVFAAQQEPTDLIVADTESDGFSRHPVAATCFAMLR
jgi:hypothetical protein